MTPETFVVSGATYRFDGMSAQTENRILRRLAPLIADALPLILAPGAQLKVRWDFDRMKAAQAVFRGWGKLSDDDTDVIERGCLGGISRERDGVWVPAWPKGAPEPVFPDIDGAVMNILVGRGLGLTLKRWMQNGGEDVPAEVRAVMRQLH